MPLSNKLECGQLIVRSGLRRLMGACVVVTSGGLGKTADPFTKIPRNPTVFAQWVCTVVEWLLCRHGCASWPVLGSQIYAVAGASVCGMRLSCGVHSAYEAHPR